jgi:hypothetical protein
VRLETLGRPTAVVVTTVFLHEAEVQRDALGMRTLVPVVVTHPLSTLSDGEIDARVEEAIGQCVTIWRGR